MFACRYAILRFLPYVETGEFANVGVVLMSTTGRFFGFRLLEKRTAHVTNFFDLNDAKPLRKGLRLMRDELERIDSVLRQFGTNRLSKTVDTTTLEALFAELTRPRETMFRFDAPRVLLTETPAAALGELFGRYVERDFVTKEYQEVVLERGLRRLLGQFNLSDRYQSEQVGNEQFHVKFPFVAHTNNKMRIIKPLHLTHAEPTKAIDHGLHWAGRVTQLKTRDLLRGEILFALQTVLDTDLHAQAMRDVQTMLRDAGAEVVEHSAQERIVEFASAS
jgi:hypothetical protein